MLRYILVAVAASGLLSGPPVHADDSQHVLVQVIKKTTGFEIVSTTLVESPLPKARNRARFFPWRLRVVTAKGALLHQAGMKDPTELRGEFQNPRDPDKIDAVHTKRKEPVHFAVRVPVLDKAARIEFEALKPDFRRAPRPPDDAFETLGSVPYPGTGR